MAARHFALARRGVTLQPLRPGPHRRRTGEACLRPLPPRGRKPKPRNRMWPVPRYSHPQAQPHAAFACGPALAISPSLAPRTASTPSESTRTACSGPMARAGPCYVPRRTAWFINICDDRVPCACAFCLSTLHSTTPRGHRRWPDTPPRFYRIVETTSNLSTDCPTEPTPSPTRTARATRGHASRALRSERRA